MKAIVYRGKNTLQLEDKEIPTPKKGWSLIKSSHAGICGSDLNIYAGVHPRAEIGLTLGHEFSGYMASKDHPTIKEGAKVTVYPLLSCGECPTCKSGRTYICEHLGLLGIDQDGGMAEYATAENSVILPMPEDMPMDLGSVVEPVAVAVHAIRKGGYKPGDSALIFGCGTIGLCIAIALRHYGTTDITLVEANELRIKKAQSMGFKVVNALKDDVVAEAHKINNNIGPDVVFDCAGHPSVSSILTETPRVGGTIVLVAAYKHNAEVNLGQGMFRESKIQFVRVYTLEEYGIALDLTYNCSDFKEIITHILSVDEYQKGFDLLTSNTDAVKVLYNLDK